MVDKKKKNVEWTPKKAEPKPTVKKEVKPFSATRAFVEAAEKLKTESKPIWDDGRVEPKPVAKPLPIYKQVTVTHPDGKEYILPTTMTEKEVRLMEKRAEYTPRQKRIQRMTRGRRGK